MDSGEGLQLWIIFSAELRGNQEIHDIKCAFVDLPSNDSHPDFAFVFSARLTSVCTHLFTIFCIMMITRLSRLERSILDFEAGNRDMKWSMVGRAKDTENNGFVLW